MPGQLKLSVGQYSAKGRKNINQDFHGVHVPVEPGLSSKGAAIALADGISSSDVSQFASETAVKSFLNDYYCTSDAWSVKKSAQQVLMATNAWLHAQSRQSQFRYDQDRGYVCTFSAIVIKSTTAHLFHIGDAKVIRLRDGTLEPLTEEHRLWVSHDKSYLSRALGMNQHLEVDYTTLTVQVGDIFILATDGIHEFVSDKFLIHALSQFADNLDEAAKAIAEEAHQRGSSDNLTNQIIRVDELPLQNADEVLQQLTELPFPPILSARMEIDGYRVIREIHASARSHIYLVTDISQDDDTLLIMKTPSIDLREDPAYLERFLMEEWIARRIDSPHVLKPHSQTRKRHFFYVITEYIEGRTLTQWMLDHPQADLETVRTLIEQIAKGLRAFHRLEMLHQDLRPDNIMIDTAGTARIIDFGSTRVAGIAESHQAIEHASALGTVQYAAPEYLLGHDGTAGSDLYSLGVIAYQMLTGKLPYGGRVAQARTRREQNKLRYEPITASRPEIPVWVDESVKVAVQANPNKRYTELSEFLFDVRNPNKAFLNKKRPPLLERDPALFWQGVAGILFIIVLFMRFG